MNVEHLLSLQNRNQNDISKIMLMGMASNYQGKNRIASAMKESYLGISQKLKSINTTLEGGFAETNQTLVEGFTQTQNSIEKGFTENRATMERGFQWVNDTLCKGFDELGVNQHKIMQQNDSIIYQLSRISDTLSNPTRQKSLENSNQGLSDLRLAFTSAPGINIDRSKALIQSAKKHFQQATDAWEANADAWFNLAWITLFVDSHPANSLNLFENAILRSVGSNNYLAIKAMRHKAEAYYELKRYSNAVFTAFEAENLADSIKHPLKKQIIYDSSRYALNQEPDRAIAQLKRVIWNDDIYLFQAISEKCFQSNDAVLRIIGQQCANKTKEEERRQRKAYWDIKRAKDQKQIDEVMFASSPWYSDEAHALIEGLYLMESTKVREFHRTLQLKDLARKMKTTSAKNAVSSKVKLRYTSFVDRIRTCHVFEKKIPPLEFVLKHSPSIEISKKLESIIAKQKELNKKIESKQKLRDLEWERLRKLQLKDFKVDLKRARNGSVSAKEFFLKKIYDRSKS